MASIRYAAQTVLQEAREGIAWIVIWKEGRGWNAEPFWAEAEDEGSRLTFEEPDAEKIRAILRIDPNAVIVNSYYSNLGDPEAMTRDSLAAAMRWQYKLGSSLLADKIIHNEEKENPESDSAKLKRDKKNAYYKERYDFLKSMGICVRCGQNRAWKGQIHCLECRFKERERQLKYYHENIEKERAKTAERHKKRRQNNIEAGLCAVCGKRKPVEGLKYCDFCRKKINTRNNRRRDLKREVPVFLYGDGQHCTVCGKPVFEDSKLCSKHYKNSIEALVKANEAKRLKKYGGWDGRGDDT